MDEGCCKESQATSPHARWTDGSKAAAEGTVISPARKEAKKQVTAAAHSIKCQNLILTEPTGIQFGEECRELLAIADD